MKIIILNILCEGQTEERFVAKVLKPYLRSKGIIAKSRLLVTNRKKGCRGGILSYAQVARDLRVWVKEVKDNSYEKNYFTTMLDLYGLPNDFPSWDEASLKLDCYELVHTLEIAFGKDLDLKNFIPYIQLHEFEALVFCGLKYLCEFYPKCEKEVAVLDKVLLDYQGNPERIDNSPETAPSKRIQSVFAKKYHYDKIKSGTEVTGKIGVDLIREKCKHFDEWLKKIEQL